MGKTTMLIVAVMLPAVVALANAHGTDSTTSTLSVFERRSDGTYAVREDLDALGDAVVPPILRVLEKARTDPPWDEMPMVKALLQWNSSVARRAVLRHVENVWLKEGHLYSSHGWIIQEIRRQDLRLACGFLGLVVNAAWPELLEHVDAGHMVSSASDFGHEVLPGAILAADALVEIGTGRARNDAYNFLITCASVVPAYGESVSPGYLSAALAGLIDRSADAEQYVLEVIDVCMFPHSELFERLPRDLKSVPVVAAIYETLDQETGVEAALDTGSELAMFEALSEMELASSIVRPDFWPHYWASRKVRFLEYVHQRESDPHEVDWPARLQAILERHHLVTNEESGK